MNQISLITFRVASQLLAMPIDRVYEIIRTVHISNAPNWSGLLHGIVNIRGAVIPVLDMRLVLSEESPKDSKRTRIIIVEMLDKSAGLVVDQVDDIVPLSKEQMVPLSNISWNKKSSILAGIAKIDGKLYMVLDIDKLIHEEERKLFKEVCFRLHNANL